MCHTVFYEPKVKDTLSIRERSFMQVLI
ncbi:uncharacterized protein METZ01_LOCUS211553, partial [marine metagenome]